MKFLLVITRPLWKFWFVLCFTIPFLLLFPFFYIGLISKNFDFVYRLKRVWTYAISIGTGLIPIIKHQSKRHKLPRPCIIVSNHTSYLDIVFSTFYIDHTAVYMGKYELLQIPLFNYFFKYLDIPVNRKSIKDSHKAFSDAGKKIDEGLSQVIYPEGTISENGKLKPFKNGAFKLAIDKQIPIIPVANVNNWKYLQNGGFFKSNGRPGRPIIVVGDPISTKGMDEKNIQELKEKVHTFIAKELEKFNGK